MNLCTVGSVAIVSSISETLTQPTGLELGRFAVALISKMEICIYEVKCLLRIQNEMFSKSVNQSRKYLVSGEEI